MKSVILLGTLGAGSILSTAGGHPLYANRAIVTDVVYVTKTAAEVIVYVDENSSALTTITLGTVVSVVSATQAVTTEDFVQSTMQPSPKLAISLVVPAPIKSGMPAFTFVTTVANPAQMPTTTVLDIIPTASTRDTTPSKAPVAEPSVSVLGNHGVSDDSLGIGITYDPFTGNAGSSRCKTDSEINDEFDRMKDYKAVRIYGAGCNIIPLAVQKAVKNGQKLMAGAYLSNTGSGEDLADTINILKSAIEQYAGGNWGVVQLFSVENERVSAHDMTASAVISAIDSARNQLRDLGYHGPVGAVETVPAMLDNLAICEASDVAMVNCHAFFDPNTSASNAGSFVRGQVDRVKSACGKRVIVTESGWPHQGDANGNAIPSPDDQRKAVASIRNKLDFDIFIFNAFDSLWKGTDPATFDAEPYWGVM